MFKRTVTMLCCTLLFAAISARADEWNKKTIMTFSQPVELPGVVLPAGTYVFKLLDSMSDRHIVQVFDKDETRIYATILALPNYRLTPTEQTVVRFTERPRNAPEAVKAWFFPGDNFGQEFVYPKGRALNLAEETKEPVLAAAITPEERPAELMKAPVETVEPPKPAAETEQAWAEIPVVTPEPPPVEAPPPAPAPAPEPELPATGSDLPLIAVLGGLSLGLAGMMRFLAKS
jgi:hypothetical protein